MPLARVKTDPEIYNGETRMDRDDWPRGFSNRGYPAVVPLWRTPKGGEDLVKMNHAWLQFEKRMNEFASGSPTNTGHPYKIFVVAYCAYNRQPAIQLDDPDWVALHENVVFAGQPVNVIERKNGSSRIETLYWRDTPPDPESFQWNNPHLVHQVTAIYNEDAYGNRHVHTGANPDYSLVISRWPNDDPELRGGWIPDERLDFDNMSNPEPAPPTELPAVYNQDFINAIYDTLQAKGIPGDQVWSYVQALDLEHLAVPNENRQKEIKPVG